MVKNTNNTKVNAINLPTTNIAYIQIDFCPTY